MAKNLIIGALLVAVLGLAYFLFGSNGPVAEPTTNTPTGAKDDGVLCAQVITPARNPDTGEIKEFQTPCDVPEGWEEIQNDIPTLDLEVQ